MDLPNTSWGGFPVLGCTVRIGLFVALLFPVGCLQAMRAEHRLPAFREQVGGAERTSIVMSDGVALATTRWLPRGEGPWPVILMRSPYPMGPLLDRRCRLLVRYGYACVHQSVRGRGRSAGAWEPFVHEASDGHDTLMWIDQQPWSAGRTAMMGESYLGAVQWAALSDAPSSLVTIVPSVFGTDPYRSAYEAGLFRHELATAWMSVMPTRGLRLFAGARYQRALRMWPRSALDEVAAGQPVPWFRAWTDHPSAEDPYWSSPEVDLLDRTARTTDRPVLMIGGWSDAFLGPQLDTWRALATQQESSLVVGPWDHLGATPSDVPLPALAGGWGSTGWISQWPRVLDWFDHHLQGSPLRFAKGAGALYVPGLGAWRVVKGGLPESEPERWWLGGAQAASRCEGTLSEQAGQLGVVGWTHDPRHPRATEGGAGMLAGVLPFFRGAPQGFRRTRAACEPGVGFRSAPLEEAVEILGAVRLSAVVAASTEDSAIVLRLLERFPDGREVLVREGGSVLSVGTLPTSGAREPNRFARVEVTTWPIAWRFGAGSQVVVQVRSSSFPKYESHGNTREPWTHASGDELAVLSLQTGGSFVDLPRFPR